MNNSGEKKHTHTADEKALSELTSTRGLPAQLGSRITAAGTRFRLWAPEAKAVTLNLYKKGDGAHPSDRADIVTEQSGGVWEYFEPENLSGVYYTFTVDGTETADPYAHTGGLNGQRGMVLDFTRAEVTPDGWGEEHTRYQAAHKLKSYTDAVIWETHIRDFSQGMRFSRHRGKYLAFTENLKNESGFPAGTAYLKELGITHVHLLPVSEYATVDQSRLDEDGYNAFNWGYDPFSHNMPSGVYSGDPRDGHSRVRELRQAVAALHSAGIGVVLDVVYNHTFDFNCPLGRVYKEYYYRRGERGNYTDGSGCGNELASERTMCRKYIIDSLKFWAEDYHIDGFRFDLMGVLDIETMRQAVAALREINPDIMIYGEGWLGGASALPFDLQANKYNVVRSLPDGVDGAAVFSDIIRDGIKGRVFEDNAGGYVNGRAWENVETIKFSVTGGTSPRFNTGWVARSAALSINYVSAHDNLTLRDKIFLTLPGASPEVRLRLNKMAAAIYFTCQGVPFMQGGEEILRSKPLESGFDHNSYKSPDEVNNIRWGGLRAGSMRLDTFEYYRGLIAFRKAHPALRLSDPDAIGQALTFIDVPGRYDVITFRLTAAGDDIYVVYNPLSAFVLTLPSGGWGLCISGEKAYAAPQSTHSGEVEIKGQSVYVFTAV